MKYYKFNPEDFGYEHVSNFPELKAFFGNTTYVKVIADGGTFDRVVYWYSYCYKIGMSGDDRWKIASSSFDISSPNEFNSNTTYCGLISTDMFARKLLMNIFGTTQNGSVSTDGKERVEQNINKKRLTVE